LSEFDSYLNELSRRSETCVLILDRDGKVLSTSDVLFDCIIHKLPPEAILMNIQKAYAGGGKYFELINLDNAPEQKPELPGKPDFRHPFENRKNESMIYVLTAKNAAGEDIVIMLNSVVSPVNATVETLRIQLVYITLIMLVLALGLSFFISGKISKPIIKINSSAQALAKGDYDISFEKKGYKEIIELADTLNYAAKELSKTENLRRDLIANVSHDLRTPLTMITGYGEVMRDLPGENTPENVQIIIDEAKRLNTLVNDMLDLSKFQSGVQKLNVTRFNLTEVVREILKRYTKLTEQDG
jgi:signal transduction histidine kinase